MGKVLIIDDDEMMAKAFVRIVTSAGHDASYALTLGKGLQAASSEEFDVVFIDVRMPDGMGLEMLPQIKETPSKPEVIIITADGDSDGAEYAIRHGAWGYIEKSSSVKSLLLPLSRAFEYRSAKSTEKIPRVLKRDRIIGKSPGIHLCLEHMAQAAACEANVLITGETGTGKELFAQAIHENSARANKNFVVLDCGCLPANLVESELFGHRKGAFTGADRDHDGLIAHAHGGTLFLDEIGELSTDLQKRFLRVLQERRFRPIGGREERASNFRLVAATNKDLDEMVERDAFRKDLLFRLRSLHIELPPLRERLDDIDDLTRVHVARLCNIYRIETKGISTEFLDVLRAYEWPGNVRELVHTLDGAVALAGGDPMLFSTHLPTHVRVKMARSAFGRKTPAPCVHIEPGAFSIEPNIFGCSLPRLKELREATERQYLHRLMSQVQKDVQRACRISGLSRTRLYELLHKHNVM
jgi:two-component system NtrC family response regulator